MKKKIIIFGATGNVGSYLTKYAFSFFENDDYEIIASGRRETDVFEKMGIDYYSVDITKKEDFDKLPKENIYAVMLLASQIPSYMKEYDAKLYIDSIINGGYNVLEYCRKVKADRILYTQTIFEVSEYEHSHIINADDPKKFSYVGDHAMYVICKNAMLEMIEHYHQEFGLKNFIFRLPTIYNYSPNPYYYVNGEKRMRPLYQMINKAINSEDIELWGDPNYSKDMVYVNDFSQMLCRAAISDRNSGYYNIGTGIPVSMKEQIETIIDVFSPKDKKSKIIYRPDKKSGGGFLLNIDNAKEELGYLPQYSCRMLFEELKKEMELNQFKTLRINE